MTCYLTNEPCELARVVGNREAIGVTLKDLTGAVVDLTGRTIVFRMVALSDGSVKVNNAAATIDDAEDGEVSYTPTASDVDTAGDYAMYFLDTTSVPHKRWPYDGAVWLLRLVSEHEVM
jgi:hypothetical protein